MKYHGKNIKFACAYCTDENTKPYLIKLEDEDTDFHFENICPKHFTDQKEAEREIIEVNVSIRMCNDEFVRLLKELQENKN